MEFNLNNWNDYVIISALRGPDILNDDLKYVITARLRYICGMPIDSHCAIRDKLTRHIDDLVQHLYRKVEENNDYYRKTQQHFLEHSKNAIRCLQLKIGFKDSLIALSRFIYTLELRELSCLTIRNALENLQRAENKPEI